MQTFVVFYGTDGETAALKEEFNHYCVKASDWNGQKNEELSLTHF